MKTIYQSNVVPADVIAHCIDDYNHRAQYQTTTMNKAPPGASLELLHGFCEQATGHKLKYQSGNFYKHTVPYLPHTDYRTLQDNTINVVVPLHYTESLPHLVIFDQLWKQDSLTWCMHLPVQYFEINIGVRGSPHEYPVDNLTGQGIDPGLHLNYLSMYPRECLYGLSGNAYAFEPGSIIVFDNQRIHCTSSFTGEKLGISLRFNIL